MGCVAAEANFAESYADLRNSIVISRNFREICLVKSKFAYETFACVSNKILV